MLFDQQIVTSPSLYVESLLAFQYTTKVFVCSLITVGLSDFWTSIASLWRDERHIDELHGIDSNTIDA